MHRRYNAYFIIQENTRKIHRKCHNHQAQPSRGTERRIDEELAMTKQTSLMKPSTYEHRRTTAEEPPWNGQKNTTGETRP